MGALTRKECKNSTTIFVFRIFQEFTFHFFFLFLFFLLFSQFLFIFIFAFAASPYFRFFQGEEYKENINLFLSPSFLFFYLFSLFLPIQ